MCAMYPIVVIIFTSIKIICAKYNWCIIDNFGAKYLQDHVRFLAARRNDILTLNRKFCRFYRELGDWDAAYHKLRSSDCNVDYIIHKAYKLHYFDDIVDTNDLAEYVVTVLHEDEYIAAH